MFFSLYFLALVSLSVVSAQIRITTCANMDALPPIARGQCIVSCNVQNCGTGNCQRRSGQATCICSRCANGGGNIPLGALIGLIRG